jgi:hypothetical protein
MSRNEGRVAVGGVVEDVELKPIGVVQCFGAEFGGRFVGVGFDGDVLLPNLPR